MGCIGKKLITLGQEQILRNFVPEFMLKDDNFQGLIYALESELQTIAGYFDLILLYLNLDTAKEEILDELAWQFNIIEYDKSYDIEIKRNLIRGCMAIHHKRGTAAAVQEVAEKIFGNAVVEEWFEYGGQPYYFRIQTENISANDEMIAEIEKVVQKTQNARSHLEEVVATIMNQTNLYFGCVVTTISDRDVFTVGIDV